MKAVLILCALVAIGCENTPIETTEQHDRRVAREAWIGECRDESTLLATTTGSPSYSACPNRLHKMRVQLATVGSNEEVGALVFCECQPDPDEEYGQ